MTYFQSLLMSGVNSDQVPPKAGKTVLVAGGAGFLGSAICARLLAEGAKVICLDNLQTGRIGNLESIRCNPNFSFVQHDVCDALSIDGEIHEIFNMACPASPPLYQIDPIHTMKTNVYGAIHLLDLAREKGARILQASTSEVYGDPEISPQPEGYRGCVNTVGPRSCYDEGKRAAETLFHDYAAVHGVPIKIARIFNTYGPNMRADDGRVVSNFINQAIRGEDITIYGDGSQTRSFCYRDDLVEGLFRLMASDEDLREPVNLGNPGEFTILELAELVLEMTGSESKLIRHPLPVDDPRQRRPDISRAKEQLGWAPTIELRQGLEMTISHFAAAAERESAEMVQPAVYAFAEPSVATMRPAVEA